MAPIAAQADEPRSSTEPRVMMEPGEVTNVVDAFDDGDRFDANISLGFQFASKSAKILRETAISEPGLTTGGYTSRLLNVAQYTSQIARLIPRIDIGLYHDFALYARLPIILSYSQKLEGLNGSDQQQSVVLQGAPGEQLFGLPFKSPDRSGVEYLALGLELDIFNQARDRSKPTWLLGAEVRLSVGSPMQACNPDTSKRLNSASTDPIVACADPSDIDRDGKKDSDFEGTDLSGRQAGVTRGTIGLEGHTILSRRLKYVEPYGGFSALVEFYDSNDFKLTNLEGSLVNHPPIRGSMMLGTMIIPWENREKFGRFTIDLRFTGTYVSEGRDYSELFDAIGSSDAPSLRNPQWAGYKQNDLFDQAVCDGTKPGKCVARSIVDEGTQKTYNTGLTDVYAHGVYRASGSATWQASEYVKFQAGFGFQFDQGHIITGDQPCNPNASVITGAADPQSPDVVAKAGPCHGGNDDTQSLTATGLPNPNYRPSMNVVGRRFYVDASMTWDVAISGTVMF